MKRIFLASLLVFVLCAAARAQEKIDIALAPGSAEEAQT